MGALQPICQSSPCTSNVLAVATTSPTNFVVRAKTSFQNTGSFSAHMTCNILQNGSTILDTSLTDVPAASLATNGLATVSFLGYAGVSNAATFQISCVNASASFGGATSLVNPVIEAQVVGAIH